MMHLSNEVGRPYASGSSRGGRAEMTLSARDIQQVTLAPKITHLCLGCRFMAPDPTVDAMKRGVGGARGHRSQFVLDLRAISLNSAGLFRFRFFPFFASPGKFVQTVNV